MTCEEFERVVTDLACEFLIEAATRKRGLAHARACTRCAMRLQKERSLTAMLNDVAVREVVQAPPRLKAALLASFREEAARPGLPRTSGPQTMWEPPALATVSVAQRRRPAWAVAAAAVLALAALVSAWQLSRRPSMPSSNQQAVQSGPVNRQTGEGPIPAVTPGPAPTTAPTPTSTPTPADVAAPAPSSTNAERTSATPRPPRRRLRPVFRPELARMSPDFQPDEEVTDFIPLTAITETADIPSGTIVRVELPRASLLAMGLPMNAERGHEIVKADVVVGDDGLARAIRLVH